MACSSSTTFVIIKRPLAAITAASSYTKSISTDKCPNNGQSPSLFVRTVCTFRGLSVPAVLTSVQDLPRVTCLSPHAFHIFLLSVTSLIMLRDFFFWETKQLHAVCIVLRRWNYLQSVLIFCCQNPQYCHLHQTCHPESQLKVFQVFTFVC